jgi:hypothetical protein
MRLMGSIGCGIRCCGIWIGMRRVSWFSFLIERVVALWSIMRGWEVNMARVGVGVVGGNGLQSEV